MNDNELELGDIKDPTQRFFAKHLLEIRSEFKKSVEPLYKLFNEQITNFDRAHDDALKLIATLSFGIAGTWLPLLQIGQSKTVVGKADILGIILLCISGLISIAWVVIKSTGFVAEGFSKSRQVKEIEIEALSIPEMKKPMTNEAELESWGRAFLPYEKKLREITNRNNSQWMPYLYYFCGCASLVIMFIGILVLASSFYSKVNNQDKTHKWEGHSEHARTFSR